MDDDDWNMEPPQRSTTWVPEFNPLTKEMLVDLVRSGLVTSRELTLWGRDRLKNPRRTEIERCVLLLRLDISAEVPKQ